MKYKSNTRRRAKEYEADIAQWWKDNKTFEKSIKQRKDDYVFYDGPPFITGLPHYGTLLSSIIKDAVPRYYAMNGKRIERVWGWDCHGLPAENFVEKQLGIEDRRQIGSAEPIEKDGKSLPPISLEKYIETARNSMVANSELWEGVIDRIGRWVDFKGAYRTMDKDFMESVWWAFKTLYDKGKIYEGRKVLMYDTKFATPVSKSEVTMDNDAYQTVTDPSVYVMFKLKNEDKYLLAWTTTPWTLPANTASAVNPKLEYIEVEVEDKIFILAKAAAERVLVDEKKKPIDHKIIRKLKGSDLIGKKYEPLFDDHGKGAHEVYGADYVEAEAGTGIVHLAPIFGEEDYELALKYKIPLVDPLDENGYYTEGPYQGLEVWSSNKAIAKDLLEKGVVWKIDYIQHEYPFNPRSKQRIMYRAIPSWFFDVQGSKPLMLEQNENITWFPPHIKHGRFAKNIDQAPDWNLSRDRFWATAMPVWKGDRGTVKVVGSYDELYELSGKRLKDYHRPWVDEITFEIDGEKFTRIDKVLDCWFESGSMPFAQFHYPFENKEKFEKNYPANFITEYVAQVRAWFYYVHLINTALFGKEAFQNVIVTGTVAGNDGRKMSKSLGNYTDPNELMDKYSADSLRFLLLSCPLLSGEDFALQDRDVGDVARKLTMIWNMYDFFTMYAEVDGWEYTGGTNIAAPTDLSNPLDKWIISRAFELRNVITKFMDEYNLPDAMSSILPFIDDASNWFVRRSRRRFWKSEDDTDKTQAYATLHFVLSYTALLLAPFTPFLSEELWHKMVDEKSSVHLQDWPEAGEIDQKVLDEMSACRQIIEKGLALRMERNDEFGQIKVRQPLKLLEYTGERLTLFHEQIIAEEVNVKIVGWDPQSDGNELSVTLDKTLTPELKAEGTSREIIRFVQNARRNAGLNVDDRIKLKLSSSDKNLSDVINNFSDVINAETLAVSEANAEGSSVDTRKSHFSGGECSLQTTVKIDSHELEIKLEKA